MKQLRRLDLHNGQQIESYKFPMLITEINVTFIYQFNIFYNLQMQNKHVQKILEGSLLAKHTKLREIIHR